MDWLQFAVLLISIGGLNAGMFAWLKTDITTNRTEASADRRDMLQIIRTIQLDLKEFQHVMAEQNRDFHGRMCAIEERNRK